MKLSGTVYASKKPPLESEIQKQILTWLKLKGIFHFRNNTMGVMRNGRWTKSPNTTKGAADIIAIKNSFRVKYPAPTHEHFNDIANGREEQPKTELVGILVAIECKRLGAKQTEEQKAFQENVEKHGGIYILAYSCNDVRAVFEQ